MLDAVLDAITARLREVLASADPPALKLRRLIAIHVETATSMQTFYSMLTSLYRWNDPSGPTTPQQLERQIAAVLGALIPQ